MFGDWMGEDAIKIFEGGQAMTTECSINLKNKTKSELILFIKELQDMLKEKDVEIKNVLELIFQYGQIDGDHHKAWVIDQIVRILTGDKYKEWIKEYTYDEETGECYSWYKGIAP